MACLQLNGMEWGAATACREWNGIGSDNGLPGMEAVMARQEWNGMEWER
jgi:hypothetical protein